MKKLVVVAILMGAGCALACPSGAASSQQTVVASDSGCAAAIAALPIPTVGDLISVQTKTKVFVPGRYVVVRSTYGELVQVWQPSHYETVIVNN